MDKNIRGIRLDILWESGLVPALPLLAKKWCEGTTRYSVWPNDLKLAPFILNVSLICIPIGAFFALITEDIPEAREVFALVGGILVPLVVLLSSVIMEAVSIIRFSPFIRVVRRLDELLIQHGLPRGIQDLPPASEEALKLVTSLVQECIVDIRRMETDMEKNYSMEDIEVLRAPNREMARLFREEFTLDVGGFPPMFAEADRILAKERSQKGKERAAST